MFSSLVKLAVVSLLPVAVMGANPKRGVCFAENNGNDVRQAEGGSASWVYNWGTTPPDYLRNTGLTYIPMQWGTGGIENFANQVKAGGFNTILGFNEPDFSSQSNVNATYAAQLWQQYIQPLKSAGVRLGGPAVTNAPSGRPWLSQFLSACTGCSFDFIPLHWYGDSLGSFYDYIWGFHGQFPNYPLWITEFASTTTDDGTATDFLKQSIAYLDSLDWIQGYSWFAYSRDDGSNFHASLLDGNGNLNARGQAYFHS